MTGIVRMGNLDTETHAGECQAEMEACCHKPKTVSNRQHPPEAERGAWTRVSLSTSRRSQPCRHLDLRLVASRTVRKLISVVLSHPFVVLLQQC